MATHKTAYYSGATPLAAGAIIGGGSEEQIEALRAFGLHTGLAFQIQDDLLNLIGTKEAANKDFRTDITEGKRTLVAVHALSDERYHDEIEAILSSGTEDPCAARTRRGDLPGDRLHRLRPHLCARPDR